MKEIPLSGSTDEGKFALVDDEDFIAVSAYSWHLHSQGYAVTQKGQLLLHRLIIGDPPAGLVVDHIDGNPLNNQRTNLRYVTSAQNMQNMAPHQNSTSRFKGVSWDKSEQLWVVSIRPNKKHVHLGRFMSELDAARAYNEAAIEHFGEYARLNVIPDDLVEPVRYRQAVPDVRNCTSQYRGVSLQTRGDRWCVFIGVEGKNIYLGTFNTEEEAARAYDTAAKLHHGDRAFLNFPD